MRCPLVKRTLLCENIFEYIFREEDLAREVVPGQFLLLSPPGHFLPRPMAVADYNVENGYVKVVFAVVGEGTKALLKIKTGSALEFSGPYGRGYTLLPRDEVKKVILLGGGAGITPLLPLAKHYGNRATAILGFHSSSGEVLCDDFRAYGCSVVIVTEDGTDGLKGTPESVLPEHIGGSDFAYTCGTDDMMRAVGSIAAEHSVPCEVTMSPKIACGVGACGLCACRALGEDGKPHNTLGCVEGPIYRYEKVVW